MVWIGTIRTLNNPYLRAVKGSTGGLRGASGTTGNLADSKLYQNFALATASDEEVKDAARYRDWAEANRSWKQWLEGPGGWLGMPGKLYGSLTMGY